MKNKTLSAICATVAAITCAFGLSACGVDLIPDGGNGGDNTPTTNVPNTTHTHNYEKTVIDPTCGTEGYTLYSCSCGDTYMDNYVLPTGLHDFLGRYCIVCGMPNPDYDPFEDDEQRDSFGYNEILENGDVIGYSVYISDFFNDSIVKFPSSYNNKPVLQIESVPFPNSKKVESIEIPSSITFIEINAFCECSKVTEVTVDSNNDTYHSDGNCIIETESKKLIYGCKTSVIPIDGSVISIGEGAFIGCDITNVVIPSIITTIGNDAFSLCSANTVEVPTTVENIGEDAFRGASVESIIAPLSVVSQVDMHKLKTVVINGGTGEIGYYLFSGCSELVSVDIQSPVTKIQGHAFELCDKLRSVNISSGLTEIGEQAFQGCISLTSINLPSGLKSIGLRAFLGCSSLQSLDIPSTVTTIEGGAFGDCSELTSIELPYGITEVGNSWFSGCSNLASVIIPNSVVSIEGFAFEDCTGLKDIDFLPDSVKSIDAYAFWGCSNLEKVNIPAGIESINRYAFWECGSITNITADSNNSTYSSKNNCLIKTAEKKIVLGCKNSVIPTDGSITEIGDNAFANLSGLTSITIPNCITKIGLSAFANCSALSSIYIPESVYSIAYNAFSGCSGLNSITVDNNNMSYYSSGNCLIKVCFNSLNEVIFVCKAGVIPTDGRIAVIGQMVFLDNSDLISISIPSSVTTIEYMAFAYCSNLTNIDYSGTKEQWAAITKDNLWKLGTGEITVTCTNGVITES